MIINEHFKEIPPAKAGSVKTAKQGVSKIGQPNLMCAACYRGAYYGIICAAGYNPDTCINFVQAYKCKGGLIYDHKITKEECHTCAKSCTGCKGG